MTIQQLKYIVALDEYRHFGKAAEACELTQSTLSLMIKKLEEELDVLLFDRNARPVTPTAMGRTIIDQAKVVLYDVEQIVASARGEKQTLTGRLHIALISTVAPILIPGLFRYLGTHCPGIELRTEEALTDTILDQLRKAEIDMGFISEPSGDPDLLEIPLYHERFYAYVSETNPLFACEELTQEQLRHEPAWVIHNGLQLILPSRLGSEQEFSYDRFFEGGRVGMLLQIVNDNGGTTLVPETHLPMILYSWQKKLRPIVGPGLSRTITLVFRRDYIREAMLNAVIRAVKSVIPERLWEHTITQEVITI